MSFKAGVKSGWGSITYALGLATIIAITPPAGGFGAGLLTGYNNPGRVPDQRGAEIQKQTYNFLTVPYNWFKTNGSEDNVTTLFFSVMRGAASYTRYTASAGAWLGGNIGARLGDNVETSDTSGDATTPKKETTPPVRPLTKSHKPKPLEKNF